MKKVPDMQKKRELAARLKIIRTEAELSQAKFAESINVTRVHYNRMEAPDFEMMPSRPILRRICETYGINMEWLLTGDGLIYTDRPPTNSSLQDNAQLIGEPLIEQTIDYVTIKTTTYLQKGIIGEKRYLHYFHLFSAMLEIFFRMMGEIKIYYSERSDVPDVFYDKYIEEYKDLLNKQKNQK